MTRIRYKKKHSLKDQQHSWLKSRNGLYKVSHVHLHSYPLFDASSGTGTANYPAGAHEFTGSCYPVLLFLVVFWLLMFVFLYFYFWPLYCLAFWLPLWYYQHVFALIKFWSCWHTSVLNLIKRHWTKTWYKHSWLVSFLTINFHLLWKS